MKTTKQFFRFPFVSRKKYDKLIRKNEQLQSSCKQLFEERNSYYDELITKRRLYYDLLEEATKINLKRNSKGQFERRTKA